MPGPDPRELREDVVAVARRGDHPPSCRRSPSLICCALVMSESGGIRGRRSSSYRRAGGLGVCSERSFDLEEGLAAAR